MTHKVIVMVAAFAAVLAFGACKFSIGSQSSGSQTFTGHGVTFAYPGTFSPVDVSSSSASASSAGAPVWQEGFGLSSTDFVSLGEYTMSASINKTNIDLAKTNMTSSIKSLFDQAGGTVDSGPTSGTVGGFPSLEYSGSVKTPGGTPVTDRITLVFNDRAQYSINCQYTSAQKADMTAGCDQILSSFKATG